MKIIFGDKELLESQTFLSIGLGETKVSLGREAETLNFILDFVQEEGKGQKFEVQPVDNQTLKLRLINWDNALGTTLTQPIEVGRFNRRKLYLLIYVKKAGSQGQIREVTFSAYLGEEAKDGEN